MKDQRMSRPTNPSKKITKKRHKCVVCNKVLKIFERNLCSCKLNVCMKHKARDLHDCPDETKERVALVKVVAPKVIKI